MTQSPAFTRVLIGCCVPLLMLQDAQAANAASETRAIWIDPASFATCEAADTTIERCHRAGLNVLLPSVMINQTIAFRSSHFPGRVAANDDFDPLAYVVERGHRLGMKVEAWCCVYYEGTRRNATPALNPQWLVRSMNGQSFVQDFLSPSIPAVNSYLLPVLNDLLAYEVDGIHLDYIRYPGTTFDYSDAGRAAFKADAGFDPNDFLDHAERIVDAGDEPYPIRVLFPKGHASEAWETTSIERTLDQAKLGYAFVSESPENIDKLRVPGLLIMSSYDQVPSPMVRALSEYAARGGDLLWTDVPAVTLAKSPELRRLLGLSSATWRGEQRVSLRPAESRSSFPQLPENSFLTSSVFDPQPEGAIVVVRRSDGPPAVLVNDRGCNVVVLGFHLMKSTSPVVPSIANSLVAWLRDNANVSSADPLAAKRAQWIAWRADRVTQLVRAIHNAGQQHQPRVPISSSGGPSAAEYYACYRDARRWLQEGINDHVYPMNYTEDPAMLAEILENQTAAAPAGKLPVIYPGLQTYVRRIENGTTKTASMDAEVVKRQIEVVREHGYRGYSLFAYNTLSDSALEAVGKINHAYDRAAASMKSESRVGR